MGRKWWKIRFWDAVGLVLAFHGLKPVLARCKRAENAFKAPCCGSSPILVVVWRQILDYDLGAKTNGFSGCHFSAAHIIHI
jgi:hypothetical protein